VRCPYCGATEGSDGHFLCGADGNGKGCRPPTEVAEEWCVNHGIDPHYRCELKVRYRSKRRERKQCQPGL
jgi:hypothetical protein